MKKNDLVKIIELVVRKEVKKQMNEIFIKENKSSLKSLTPKKVVKKKPVQKQNVQFLIYFSSIFLGPGRLC